MQTSQFSLSIVALLWTQSLAADYLGRKLQGFDLENCVPRGQSEFNIQLINMGPVTTGADRYDAFFELAAERWMKIIVGDVSDFPAGTVDDWFGGLFSQPYNGAVDDLVIGYEVSRGWDGPGGTLGRAGPAARRTSRTGVSVSTVSGIMQFDLDDFELMDDEDVKPIILHEMGHVLGLVGTVGNCNEGCNPNNPSVNGRYQCSGANTVYSDLTNGVELLLENRGGPGTACGHWEESSFRTNDNSELMTGFFEEDLFQPISLVTVAALDDLGGYEVDFCGADIWPANADTVQRFDVFRTKQGVNGVLSGTEGIISNMPASAMASSGCGRALIWLVSLVAIPATLLTVL